MKEDSKNGTVVDIRSWSRAIAASRGDGSVAGRLRNFHLMKDFDLYAA